MDANRTFLLAQNGVPGEYIPPSAHLRQSPAQDPALTMQRRGSLDTLDSTAREKADAHTASTPRSGVRAALSRVARRLSGAGEKKHLTAGQAAVASSSAYEHEPFQVYVVGDQVVYLGRGSKRGYRKESEEKRGDQRGDIMGAEIERVKIAKERRMSSGHWVDGGVASDARVMRRTS